MRFRTEEIPSSGSMEINKDNTWEKLCTANWDDAEENLICRAMGYFNNGPNDDSTQQEGTNGSNTTTHRNCTPAIHKCHNNRKEHLQSCKGIYHIILLQCDKRLVRISWYIGNHCKLAILLWSGYGQYCLMAVTPAATFCN